MIPPEFKDAFDTIAVAAEKAGELKHADRPNPVIEAEAHSPGHQVSVLIRDGKLRSLRLEDDWVVTADGLEVEELIIATVNEALDSWGKQSLAQLQNLTPELSEVTAVIAAARAQTHQAFQEVIARSREL